MSKVPTRRTSNPFLIGLFVVVGTFTLIGVIIWLGATQFFQENMTYVTYFSSSIEGLESGSKVKYMGVPVGSVKKITVAPDGKLIEVIMVIDMKIKIDSNIRSKAEIAGLAGGKFIQLYYPSDTAMANSNPPLNFIPKYKLIKSSPSGMDEIEIAAKDVMSKLMKFKYQEVSEEMIKFLQTTSDFFQNKELYEIITNLRNTSDRLSSIMERADSSNIINNLTTTSLKLVQTANKLENFADSLNAQIYGLDLSKKVDRAMSQYDSVMLEAKRVMYVLGYRFDNTVFSLDETLNEIRHTNNLLQKTLKAYSDDPGRMLLSTPPPEEK